MVDSDKKGPYVQFGGVTCEGNDAKEITSDHLLKTKKHSLQTKFFHSNLIYIHNPTLNYPVE
jgi:hypothetical protein